MASHLDRATYRTLHSLRRRAAGEHVIETERLVVAFGSEWGLGPFDMQRLRLLVLKYETEMTQKGAT
jgi:hypothetical protein